MPRVDRLSSSRIQMKIEPNLARVDSKRGLDSRVFVAFLLQKNRVIFLKKTGGERSDIV